MGLCSRKRVRAECCGCANWGLGHFDRDDFVRPQGRCIKSNIPYAIYKTCIAVFLFIWIILSGAWDDSWYTTQDNAKKWFIYLTNWSFFMLNVSFIIQAALAIHYCIKRDEDGDKSVIPWYYKMEWAIHNVAIDAGVLTSLLFWALLYYPELYVSPVDYNTHATNSVIILVDLFINAIPIRIQHFWHTFVFYFVYLIFTIIYDFSGATNSRDKDYIYSVLDWNDNAGDAVMYAVIVAVIVPVVWCMFYGLYWLRLVIYNGCSCKTEDGEDEAYVVDGKEHSTKEQYVEMVP